MIKRLLLQSQIMQDHEGRFVQKLAQEQEKFVMSLRAQGFSSFSLFRYQSFLFIYLETEAAKAGFQWQEPYTEFLETWPGEEKPRYAVPMNDIFHDNRPHPELNWRDGYVPERRVGSLAKLKPEMYGSYVFYHYQLQEEKPASFNKYYIIGSQGRYIFSYQEQPAVNEAAPTGLLSTDNTPDQWHEVMNPHFEFWSDKSDKEKIWRDLQVLISF